VDVSFAIEVGIVIGQHKEASTKTTQDVRSLRGVVESFKNTINHIPKAAKAIKK
jgi:hypothetical protein